MHEAGARLSHFSSQASFTSLEFHELHFKEDLQDSQREALKDPFWDDLFLSKKEQGDLAFFTSLPLLINQPPFEFRQAMRLFCVKWDRATIPLEYWTGEAARAYLEASLIHIHRRDIAPSEETLRQWRHRLRLKLFKAPVITGYTLKGEIPDSLKGEIPDGCFCQEAFELAGIPAPSL
jgi:hypothetical protein